MPEPETGPVEQLSAARGGSRAALGELLEACRAYLLVVAEQELAPDLRGKGGASDLVQETFLEAQRDFGHFQGGSATELRAWLRQVLINNLANFTRRYRQTGKRDIARELPLAEDTSSNFRGQVESDIPSPSRQAMANERAAELERALARLSPEERQIIALRHDEALSFEEIGLLMNRSHHSARRLWARAVERLQQELEASP